MNGIDMEVEELVKNTDTKEPRRTLAIPKITLASLVMAFNVLITRD
jgi:hypothetical protein